jgi:hypothetical protein
VADDQPAVTLTFGETSPQREFRSFEDFNQWFISERAKWDWLRSGNQSFGNFPNLVNQHFNEVASLIEQAKAQPDPLRWIANQAEQRWGSGGFLRYSEGRIGTAILDIRQSAGDEAAAFAYAFHLRQVNASNAATIDQFKGLVLLAIPGMADPADLANRLSNERNNFKAAQASSITRLDKALDQQEERFSELVGRVRRVAARMLRLRYRNWNKLRDHLAAQLDASKTEIDNVRVAYEESMRLQGPVKYWSGKAREHGKREFWAAFYVILFFFVGTAILASAFGGAGYFVFSEGREAIKAGLPEPHALYLLITAGLAALSTLTFWIGRLLTKLWMSEHHLRNDAHERAVMTTTYLALTRNEKAADNDRQIILTALFRNTPDGIVKEDGADFGWQAVVSKYLAKP